ncbi:MAG: phage tail protein [Pigmentiphaga sp.]|nr:phage tail protein [Pigmentiphaga sp.]
MFAMLGPISFRLITYFEGVSNKRGYDYARHEVIEGKPRLQWMGDDLEEVDIDLMFHVSYCNPEAELAKLKVAGSMHTALPLIYGSGQYVGMFVIRSIRSTARQTNSRGALVAVTARVTLIEHGGLGGLLGTIISVVNNAARASGAGSNTRSSAPAAAPAGDPGGVSSGSIVRQ